MFIVSQYKSAGQAADSGWLPHQAGVHGAPNLQNLGQAWNPILVYCNGLQQNITFPVRIDASRWRSRDLCEKCCITLAP